MTFCRLSKCALLSIAFLPGLTSPGLSAGGFQNNPSGDQQNQQAPAKKGRGKASADPQGNSGRTKKSTKKNEGIHLQGVLVEGGAECQRFRADDNRYYTLLGDLHGFHTGDRVEISGNIAEVSHCMQDTTLTIKSIRKVQARPSTSPPRTK